MNLSLFEPNPVSKKRIPRSYQNDLASAWESRRTEGRGKLAVLFTGAGKSLCAARVASTVPGRVMFLCNRTELRRQAMETLATDSGKRWQVEQSDSWASVDGKDSVVALVQSLVSAHPLGKRYMRFARDSFDLIIVDEIHLMMSDGGKEVLEYFDSADLLGLTATPAGKDYRPLFTVDLFNFPLKRALEESWSVGYDFRTYHAPQVNLDGVEWTGHDWSRKALDEAMVHAAAAIAKAAVDECDDLKMLVFCPGIAAIEAATDAINKLKPDSARALHSKQSDIVCQGNIRDHKAGKFQYLVSCGKIGVGYDDPEIQGVLLAKPISKQHEYEQIIGRGGRLWPGIGGITDFIERKAAIAASKKPVCRIIDLVCASEKHTPVHITDILGGDYTERERSLARKALDGKGGKDKSGGRKEAERDPVKMLEWARRELEFRDAMAEQAKKAKVELKRKEKADPNGPPTDGELRKLAEFSIPISENMTHADANKLLRYEFLCRAKGWCNFKQRAWIQANCGIRDARGMSIARGTELANLYKKRKGIG